ncbi:MAG: nitrous oxide reductase accessory protein NosL [Campylobacterales bacterium]|nr:nitrous oxide reductase accessory protein NosL [Campylobacterales bacterium]
MFQKVFLYLFFLLSLYSSDLTIHQNKEGKEWCPVSGKSLEKSYKTSAIAKLKINGRKRHYSSIEYLLVDQEEYGLVDIKVYDKKRKTFVEIPKKLLEEKRKNLKKFLSKEKKRKKHYYKAGKKIFKKNCKKDLDPTDYIEINELKHAMKYDKICKPLKEKNLHKAALYIWDIKRAGDLGEVEDRVKIEESEKCPVCGMFTYKYPRWAAQIHYSIAGKTHHFSFDGVKDLIKFYFHPLKWGNYTTSQKKNISKILVTDYYTQRGIDGFKAYYVIRSNIYGPMGHELIPFEDLEDAKEFKKDHLGMKILTFDKITEELAYRLDRNR